MLRGAPMTLSGDHDVVGRALRLTATTTAYPALGNHKGCPYVFFAS